MSQPGRLLLPAHHALGETEACRQAGTGSRSPSKSPSRAGKSPALMPPPAWGSQNVAVGTPPLLPEPGLPGPQPPVVYDPRSPSAVAGERGPGRREAGSSPLGRRPPIDCACAALILHLIRAPFPSPGFLAAFKLSHKIYLLFHEYISSRQAQAFYIFTLYIFHGRLIAVSKAERGRGERASRRSRQLVAEGGRQGEAHWGRAQTRLPRSPRPCRADPRLLGKGARVPPLWDVVLGPDGWG